jgi:hypothetical protein
MSLSTTKTRDYPKVDFRKGVNPVRTVTTTTYTISNEDRGFVILLNPSANATITLAILSVPIGTQIDFINLSANSITFNTTAGSGINIRSKASAVTLAASTPYIAATAIKISNTEWFLVGDLS